MSNGASKYEYVGNTVADTVKLASSIAEQAIAGTVIALDGDLGAGKTRFSQAFAHHIGVKGVVNSPTFTIIKEYQGAVLPLYHMDVYRVSLMEAEELGLDEYLYGEGVSIVEWASLIPELLPKERLSIYIEHLGEEERRFRIEASGELYVQWCNELKQNGVIQDGQ